MARAWSRWSAHDEVGIIADIHIRDRVHIAVAEADLEIERAGRGAPHNEMAGGARRDRTVDRDRLPGQILPIVGREPCLHDRCRIVESDEFELLALNMRRPYGGGHQHGSERDDFDFLHAIERVVSSNVVSISSTHSV
jgi:hypothetical protein